MPRPRNILTALALAAGLTIIPASAQADDSPGCVTRDEGQVVEGGWSKPYTHRHFGTNGNLVRRVDPRGDVNDRLIRRYDRCNGDTLRVEYRKWWGAWAVYEVRGVPGWGEA